MQHEYCSVCSFLKKNVEMCGKKFVFKGNYARNTVYMSGLYIIMPMVITMSCLSSSSFFF